MSETTPPSSVPTTMPLPDAGARAAWRVALPVLGLVLLALGALYFETFAAMERIWARSETFAHAYVVPPIALWLMWRRRAALARQAPRPNLWFALPLALAALAWGAAQMVAVNAVAQLAATTLLVLAVPLVLGLPVTRVIFFPLVYLYFAVPIGEFLMPPLMQGTADFTVGALRLSGIPVYREGLQFVIPSGNWSVVEACSGVRYLMASFMVGTLFAYLNYRSWRRRLVFAIVSVLVPIVANWLRAYMIVMLGHLSGNKLAVGADHLVYGWVFFGVVITLLFMVGARWAEDPLPDVAAAQPPEPSGAPAPSEGYRRGLATAALALVALGLPHAALRLQGDLPERADVAVALPATLGADWRATPLPTEAAWEPAWGGYTAKAAARYIGSGGRAVDVHIRYYQRQGGERKLVSSNHAVVTSENSTWNAVAATEREAGDGLTVRETRLLGRELAGTAERPRLRVWQVYRVGDAWAAGDVQAKLLTARQRLRGRGDAGAAVFLATPDGDSAAATLAAFLTAHRTRLEAAIDAAHRGAGVAAAAPL